MSPPILPPPASASQGVLPFLDECRQRLLEGDYGDRDHGWYITEITRTLGEDQATADGGYHGEAPHVIWSSRDNHELLEAWGAVRRWDLTSLDELEGELQGLCRWLEHQPGRLKVFGGRRFADSSEGGTWKAFPAASYWVPRVVRMRSGALERWLVWTPAGDDAAAAMEARAALHTLDTLRPAEEGVPLPATLGGESDRPGSDRWNVLVNDLLDRCGGAGLEKVVLARQRHRRFTEPLSGLDLFRRLRRHTPESFHYFISPASGVAFLGASPERLYAREGRHVETEAVAGTRPRGAAVDEDARLGEELLASEKDRREHRFVREEIVRQLEPLSHAVRCDAQNRLIRQASGQHLYAAISADLRDGVTDADLLSRLHPTPAVGGLPTGAALDWLRTREPIDRGWYAAPVGWMSRRAAEFTVAIRGGLVQGESIDWFAGAGIVPGSTPADEWREVEQKMSLFGDLLTDGDD